MALLFVWDAVMGFGVETEEPSTSDLQSVVMVLGDSLSAGYGIEIEQGWVRLLQTRLELRGLGHRVVNASISGDTTRGARDRLPGAMRASMPSIVIVELGGNDGLRGLPLTETQANLSAIIGSIIADGARVVLVGIRLPPNYGPAYTKRFETIFVDLADQHSVPLVPFLLDGVALDSTLMQEDGIHPRANAQQILLDNVWPSLQTLIQLDTQCTADDQC